MFLNIYIINSNKRALGFVDIKKKIWNNASLVLYTVCVSAAFQ